jgi:hypothetical protein
MFTIFLLELNFAKRLHKHFCKTNSLDALPKDDTVVRSQIPEEFFQKLRAAVPDANDQTLLDAIYSLDEVGSTQMWH